MDIQDVLNLLASADDAQSRRDQTAGESMRFYNMARDRLGDTRGMAGSRPTAEINFTDMNEGLRPRAQQLSSSLSGAQGNGVVLSRDIGTESSLPLYSASVRQQNMPVSNVELDKEQYDQMLLAMRAALPLPEELQAVMDRYTSPQSGVGQAITQSYQAMQPDLRQVALIRFLSDESGLFRTDPNALGYVVGAQYQPEQNRTSNISFQRDVRDYDRYADALPEVALHEAAHNFDMYNPDRLRLADDPASSDLSRSDLYKSAQAADASLKLPDGFDTGNAIWSYENAGMQPTPGSRYASQYSEQRYWEPAEDFAERLAMYETDRQNGYIAVVRETNRANQERGGNLRYYRFADLWPSTAQYFDSLFGVSYPTSATVRQATRPNR